MKKSRKATKTSSQAKSSKPVLQMSPGLPPAAQTQISEGTDVHIGAPEGFGAPQVLPGNHVSTDVTSDDDLELAKEETFDPTYNPKQRNAEEYGVFQRSLPHNVLSSIILQFLQGERASEGIVTALRTSLLPYNQAQPIASYRINQIGFLK